MTFALVLRRLLALVVFIVIVVVFRGAARKAGAKPWHWSALGVLVFYGTTILVALAGGGAYLAVASLTGGGLSPAERHAMPLVVVIALALALVAASAAAVLTLRWLVARASKATATPATSNTLRS